jgi:hypothetical protein
LLVPCEDPVCVVQVSESLGLPVIRGTAAEIAIDKPTVSVCVIVFKSLIVSELLIVKFTASVFWLG